MPVFHPSGGSHAWQPYMPLPSASGASRPARFDGELIDTPVVARAALASASNGPLLVDEYDSTVVVPPDMRAQLDDDGNLILEPRGG